MLQPIFLEELEPKIHCVVKKSIEDSLGPSFSFDKQEEHKNPKEMAWNHLITNTFTDVILWYPPENEHVEIWT